MLHAVQTLMPRRLPVDNTIFILARAHRNAWGEHIRAGGNDHAAAEDAEALVSCLALLPAKTREGFAEKASIIRSRLLDSTVAELLADVGLDSPDGQLIASFVQDALAVEEQGP
jgi:hypothetical protein